MPEPRHTEDMTTNTAAHAIQIVTACNGGSKSRRAVCSCGWLGVRFAYAPAAAAKAQAKAEAEAAEHKVEVR